jgi:hypothetical protein
MLLLMLLLEAAQALALDLLSSMLLLSMGNPLSEVELVMEPLQAKVLQLLMLVLVQAPLQPQETLLPEPTST